MEEKRLKIAVKTMAGLEDILHREIMSLGGSDMKIGKRVVEVTGDLGFLYKLTFNLRTALRVLRNWKSGRANDSDAMYRLMLDWPWEEWIKEGQSFKIDATTYGDGFTHSQYARQRMKDAILDRLKEKKGFRPEINLDAPDHTFNLYASHGKVEVSLDAAGFSLHKRGYRILTHPAPLNEVLAAGIVKMVNWNGIGSFIDPMCGSGTLLIEAAWNAFQIPPQVLNSKFAFQGWPDYDEELWKKIQEISMNKIKDIPGNFIGFDKSRAFVEAARANVKEAKLNDEVPIFPNNFFSLKAETPRGVLVMNPPYNKRIEFEDDEMYTNIGDTLKKNFPGYEAWVFSGNPEALKAVGLRTSKRVSLKNGDIDCKLVKYELYQGSKKAKKS